MAKYTSGRQRNLSVGINSFTEDKTVLDVTGKVGINTTNASASLEVVGGATFIGSTTGELVRITQTGSGPAFLVEDSENPDVTPFLVTTQGKVAIGVAAGGISTSYKLEVDGGDIRFVTGGEGDLIISHQDLVSNIRANGTVQLGLGANGGDAIRINLDNNVGLGTTNPTSKLYVDGDGYFTGVVTSSNFYVGNNLVSAGGSFSNINVSGLSTFVGFSTFSSNVAIAGSLDVNGNINFNGSLFQNNQPFVASRWTQTTTGDNIYRLSNVGIGTSTLLATLTVRGDANISGVATISRIVSAATSFSQLQVSGISTFDNGPVFIGTGTTTGTASQRLQVTGGAYVSGSVGVGTTNPRETLDVIGTIGVQASGVANRFQIQYNSSQNSLDFIFI
jgi:hypothetical protein